eukprot:NODE_20367_length_801_cov_4.011869.p2 GENE.NODE_20367_length_801_cov_4.011869~~NODE_20367_length_801_cov_4.011869.p2  ORF type:complete len:77 (+),score=9.50 NODE_20367_length_801_cov_4.011869:147-377(+)
MPSWAPRHMMHCCQAHLDNKLRLERVAAVGAGETLAYWRNSCGAREMSQAGGERRQCLQPDHALANFITANIAELF